MVDGDTQESVDVPPGEEVAEPEFDRMAGVLVDGVVGAVGGAVGTAAATIGLFVTASVGAFDFDAFAALADLTGLIVLAPGNPNAVGYGLFLAGGMVTFPLLLASIGTYLPGEKFAYKGIPFGFVLWTGFAPAFYAGQTGATLAIYLAFTLVAHFSYGFTLGAVFDYFSNRPDTIV